MKKLTVHSDGSFRILQVSDAQDMHFVRRAMPYMLNTAYDREKPDLVVFTGDNILGNHLCDRRFGSGKKNLSLDREYQCMKKALSFILQPLEDRKIPFAMIFGNHDDRNRITKEQQLDIFRSYTCFVEGNGCITGNREIPIYDASGEKQVYSLWLFDSARYIKEEDRCEETVLPETVEWFKKQSASVSSLAFVHIPLPVTAKLLKEDEKGLQAPDGKKYSLDGACCVGTMLEFPSMLQTDNGLFEALKANGNVKAVVFGHDHPNNFIGTADGIDIVQTSCASFRCYGNKKLRGVRVFDLDLEKPKTYTTRFLSYEDLCGNGFIDDLRYFYNADEYEKQKSAVLAGLAGVTALAGLTVLLKKINS